MPHRVILHMSQALVFRFYSDMASQGGFDTPAQYCGTSQHFQRILRSTVYSSVKKLYSRRLFGSYYVYNYVGPIDRSPSKVKDCD